MPVLAVRDKVIDYELLSIRFITGVRMLDGDVTDVVEASSLSLNSQHIDIYSSSWGPTDDGRTLDGPGKLTKQVFVNGISKVYYNN